MVAWSAPTPADHCQLPLFEARSPSRRWRMKWCSPSRQLTPSCLVRKEATTIRSWLCSQPHRQAGAAPQWAAESRLRPPPGGKPIGCLDEGDGAPPRVEGPPQVVRVVVKQGAAELPPGELAAQLAVRSAGGDLLLHLPGRKAGEPQGCGEQGRRAARRGIAQVGGGRSPPQARQRSCERPLVAACRPGSLAAAASLAR